MPTARNARGVDLIAYNSSASDIIGVQVKALSKRSPVPLGSSLSKVMGHYWVVINNIYKEPRAFVLRPEDVKRLASKNEKDGRVSYWLDPKRYDTEDFFERWDVIGDGHG